LRQIKVDPLANIARALRPQHRTGHCAWALAATVEASGADPLLLVLACRPRDPRCAASGGGACGRCPCPGSKLVTFGIVPKTAETGYGYIQRGPRRAALPDRQVSSSKSPICEAQAFLARVTTS